MGSDDEVCHARVKLLKERWGGVCFFREHFPRVVIIENRNLAHGQEALGLGNDMEKILLRQGIIRIGIPGFAEVETGLDVQLPGGGQCTIDLKLGNGPPASFGEVTVNRPT